MSQIRLRGHSVLGSTEEIERHVRNGIFGSLGTENDNLEHGTLGVDLHEAVAEVEAKTRTEDESAEACDVEGREGAPKEDDSDYSDVFGITEGKFGRCHGFGYGRGTMGRTLRVKIEDEDTIVVIGYLEGKAAADPMAMAKYNCTEDGISKEGLSGCAHRLYASHLQKNVTSNGNEQLFHDLFSRWLYAEMEEEEFEAEWEQATFEYGLENKMWAVQMYEKKHMANAYMRGKFCL
ncbi:hypothetical protein PIB30_069976 [Stylosanthes scabra]|uniref:Uncharacterized protein n=1 Tax=Stylosanthes scabra TaxID=79078 RepID=A0ABU6VPA6_9FABA|nr:hypothetical protein [Stylosanthes scabra]